MPIVNIPRFLNALVAKLQPIAEARGVRLVADTSTNIVTELDSGLVSDALFDLGAKVLERLPRNAALSLISFFEPSSQGDDKGQGRFKIQITAPGLETSLPVTPLRTLEAAIAGHGTLHVEDRPDLWTLNLVLAGAREVQSERRQRTVVVVDDDVDTQEFLAAVLESQDYRVVTVNDGFDALLAIERHDPDVVLTDVLMPNMDGIDLVARIRKVRSQLPVIVFSGYRDALMNNVAGLPDAVLRKPLSRDQLLAAIDHVLARSPSPPLS